MANNRIVVQQGQTAGAILGTYDIFGTNVGAETVTVFDGTTANFQGDFGRGGDIIRIADVAGDFTVALSGSNIVLTSASDGITVRIPVGTVGAKVVFENAAGQLADERTLIFNGSSVILGNQVVTAVATAVNGGDQGNNPTTTVLTAGQDVLTGTSSADTYVAQNTNLNAGDIIDGGAGSDRLRVFADRSLSQASYAGFEVSNVETLEFTNDSAGLGSFDLSSSSGFETLVNRNSTQAVAFNQLTALANLVIANLTNSATSATTVQFQDLVVAGSADAVTVTLNSTDASTIRIGSVADDDAGIETLNLEVSGRATKVDQIDSDITTLNLSGAQNLSIAQALNSTIKTVAGASYTGDVSLSVEGAAAGVTIDLGSGNDTVTGSSKADTINVRAGNNNVAAGDGNDTVTAGDGSNVINSGAGNDTVTVGGGANVIDAGAGDDGVTVGNGANAIVTGSGDNRVTGGNGANTVTGGTGVDTIELGNGANSIDAGDGANRVTVGGGVNTVTSGTGADLVNAGDGGNSITTNGGNDTINAGDGNDSIAAGAGNDSVSAGGGNDTISAGDGDDFVSAGAGNDQISVGTGVDTVLAGAGNDTIDATVNFDADGTFVEDVLDADGNVISKIFTPDRDSIDGGADRDTLVVTAGATDANFRFVSSVEVLSVTTAGTTTLSTLAQAAGIDQVDARNAGNDIVDAATFTRGLTVNLTGGDDKVTTGSGNDTINIASFTNGDTLNAGAGQDTLNLDADTAISGAAFAGFERVNLGSGRDEDTDGHAYSFVLDNNNAPNPNTTGIDPRAVLTVNGTALAADTDGIGPLSAETLTLNASAVTNYRLDISSGAAGDSITDGALDDTINAGAGADTITLTGGNNNVVAGDGNDTVTLGTGVDSVLGGDGDDLFAAASGNLTKADVVDGNAGANTLQLNGSSVDDQFTGVSNVQTLTVTSAASTTVLAAEAQEAGIRTVNMANGNGTLNASAFTATADLTVNGGTGDDAITTGAGNDSVVANDGNDTITTGAGNDIVLGGNGNDVIASGDGNDTVTSGNGDDSVNTGGGDDVVSLGAGIDTIDLGDGNDRVTVTSAVTGANLDYADRIDGGAGSDEIVLDNSVVRSGGSLTDPGSVVADIDLSNVVGVETVRIGADGGSSTINFQGGNVSTITAVTVDATVMSAANGSSTLVTITAGQTDSDFAFNILGGSGRDVLVKLNNGVNNNVLFNAGAGNDDFWIGRGEDLGSTTVLVGGADTDSIVVLGGNVSDDGFTSVSGFERLTASGARLIAQLGELAQGAGLTTVDADPGAFNDNLFLDAKFTGPLTVSLGFGNDIVNASATSAALTFKLDAAQLDASDLILAGTSANDVVLLRADGSTANATTTTGVERYVIVDNGDASVGVTLSDASFAGVAGNTIVIDGSALDDLTEGSVTVNAGGLTGARTLVVTGGTGNDTILTGAGNDTIFAAAGDDVINAGNGDNFVRVGSGNNSVVTGTGNDDIANDSGNNTVSSGAGNDRIALGDGNNVVDAGIGNNTLTLGNGANNVVTGSGNDTLTLGDGANTVVTDSGTDSVTAGKGNNVISTGADNDSVTATDGNNRVDLGSGNDTLVAGNGNNTVVAGAGNDNITLGNGNNSVTGGLGVDQVTLGSGANTVRFVQVADSSGLAGRDTVVGFDSNDLVQIETNVLSSGVSALNWAGVASDSQAAGLAINKSAKDGVADIVYDASTGRLLVDINDDGQLDAQDLVIDFNNADGSDTSGAAFSSTSFKLVDTIAPSLTSIDLLAGSDSGVSNSDDLTNVATVTVKVSFDTLAVDGTRAKVGDNLTLLNAQTGTSQSKTLTAGDLTAGFVEFSVAMSNPGNPQLGTVNALSASLSDAAGNSSSASLNVTFDNQAPSVTVSDFDGADGFLNAGEDDSVVIAGTATPDAAGRTVSVSATDGINTVNGSAVVLADGTWATAGLNMAGLADGNVTVSANVQDGAGNTGTATAPVSVHDKTLPTLVISDDEAATANIAGGNVVYTFAFSEVVTGFTLADISITNGVPVGNLTTDDSGKTYKLTVTPKADFEGTMTVSVPSAAVVDNAGNANALDASSTQLVDTIAPVINIATPVAADGIVNNAEDNVLTISGSVDTPLASSVGQTVAVTVTDANNASRTASAVVKSDGTWSSTNMDVSGLAEGNLTVLASVTDAGGNAASKAITIVHDSVAPTALVARTDGTAVLKDADRVATFRVTLSEGSTTFTQSDLTVTGGTITGFTAVSATEYDVEVTAPDDSTTTVNITVNSGTFADIGGNPSLVDSNTVFVIVDTVNPTPTIARTDTGTLFDGDNTAIFSINFTEAVTGLTVEDFTIAGGTGVLTGSGASYTLTVTADDNSTAPVSVALAADKAVDKNGNGNIAGNTVANVLVDTVNPTVGVIRTDSGTLNDADNQAEFRITLSEGSSNFAQADLAVTGGSVSSFVAVSASVYDVKVTANDPSTVPVTLQVKSESFTDTAGNKNLAASTTLSVDVDTENPFVTAESDDRAGTANGAVTYLLTFNEPVTGLESSDFTVANGKVTFLEALSSTEYRLVVVPDANENGIDLGIALKAGGVADGQNNAGLVYTFNAQPYDTIAPASPGGPSLTNATNSASLADQITNVASPVFQATAAAGETLQFFNDANNNNTLDAGEALTGAGAPLGLSDSFGTAAASAPLADGSYNVKAIAIDGAGNKSAPSGGTLVTIDTTAPTASVARTDGAATLNDADPVAIFRVTLSEGAADFIQGDLTVVGGSITKFTPVSATEYDVEVTGEDASTTPVTLQVKAASFSDTAGNNNTSASNSGTATVDTLNPTPTIGRVDTGTLFDGDNEAVFSINFNEDVFGLAAGDFVIGGGTGLLAGSGKSYTLTVTANDSSIVPVSVSLAAGTVSDAVGNLSLAANAVADVPVDTVNPTAAIARTDGSATLNIADPVAIFRVTLSEGSTSFAQGDLDATGGSITKFTAVSATEYDVEVTAAATSTTPVTLQVKSESFTDTVGNKNLAASNQLTVTADTVGPAVLISEPIMGDNRINAAEDEVVSIAGSTKDVEAGRTVTITITKGMDTVTATATVKADGTWATTPEVDLFATFKDSAATGDTLTISAAVSDLALNPASDTASVLYDNKAPVQAFTFTKVEQETNDPATNSGDTVTDKVTNQTSADVTFGFDLALDTGDTIQAFIGGKWVTLDGANSSLDTVAKSVTIKDFALVAEGNSSAIELRVVDAAQNNGPASPAPGTVIVLDTTAPTKGAPVTWTSVSEEQPTTPAKNDGDQKTKDDTTNQATATVVFTYAGDDLPTGERWQYSTDGGSLWIDGLNVDTTANTLTQTFNVKDSPTIKVRAIDEAGNETAVLASQKITYDADMPTPGAVNFVKVAEGTFDALADKLTNKDPADVTFSYTNALGAGEIFQYSVDSGTTWVNGTITVDATTKQATITGLDLKDNDTTTVQVRAIDEAGNETAVLGFFDIVHDNKAPTVSAVQYNNTTDVFTLTGTGFDTNGKATVDITKISWDVDGDGTAEYVLPSTAAGSKVSIVSDTQITVTLTREAAAGLEGLTGFAGSTEDQVIIGADAFADNAGNKSTSGTFRPSLVLDGTDNSDNMFGGRQSDSLSGGLLNDTLTGGDGADTLTGGSGADVFLIAEDFHSGDFVSDFDVITDFQTGIDKINLEDAIASTNATVVDLGVFANFDDGYDAADDAMNANDGNVIFFFGVTGGPGYLVIDSDTDGGSPDMVIQLDGITLPPVPLDFILG